MQNDDEDEDEGTVKSSTMQYFNSEFKICFRSPPPASGNAD